MGDEPCCAQKCMGMQGPQGRADAGNGGANGIGCPGALGRGGGEAEGALHFRQCHACILLSRPKITRDVLG